MTRPSLPAGNRLNEAMAPQAAASAPYGPHGGLRTATQEEDTVPPVTLTATPLTAVAASPADPACASPACAGAAAAFAPVVEPGVRADEAVATNGPRLRLVTTNDQPAGIVHGHDPSSCGCRECAMARHPASMPRLTVV
ncbi:hypothetical protein [Frankia sp. Cj3]|uniref:hypothetical protein n=1 Tax=Frankia sp. Cj3 TaxID=2880976 RepID=UPI0027E138D3|nr:hypothetical protein [Frankia sp. Cj3]